MGIKFSNNLSSALATDRASAVRAGISSPSGQWKSIQDSGTRMDAATVWERLADGRQAENMERQYSQAGASLRLCTRTKEKGYSHLHLLSKSKLYEDTNYYIPA